MPAFVVPVALACLYTVAAAWVLDLITSPPGRRVTRPRVLPPPPAPLAPDDDPYEPWED